VKSYAAMMPDLKDMKLTELLDLLSLKTSEFLKAIHRRNRTGNVKELKKEVETIQAAIQFQKNGYSSKEFGHPEYTG
jgi:hypothetical protein